MKSISKLFSGVGQLKDRECGKRAFVLANGPSITQENLRLLKGEVVIGMNASTMLEEPHGFVSSYYVLSDPRFINHPEKRAWGTTRLNPKTMRVVRKEMRRDDEPGLAARTSYVPALSRNGFSKDLRAGFYYGCTTTMLALQLAYHLGCREVYLLGCDLRYSPESPRFYAESNPQLEDSFTSVQIHNIVNAAEVFEGAGGQLHNCSARSFLRPYLGYTQFVSAFEGSGKDLP